jgi:hypothetical protein
MQQKQKAKTSKQMLRYFFMEFVDFNKVFVDVKILLTIFLRANCGEANNLD